jgi:hypothetical protein
MTSSGTGERIDDVPAKGTTRTNRVPWLPQIRAVATAALILAALSLLAASYFYVWHVPWFEQRATPTIAIAHGQSIYHMPASGPLIGSTYAPLSYLAFLPIAVFRNIWTIFAAGSLMATCYLLLPIYLALRRLVAKGGLERSDGLFLLVFGFAAIAFLRPLNYIATIASADSPAIFLMALSLLILYWDLERPRWTSAALSSLALAASVGCKQNMLIAAVVIVAAVFYGFNWRFAWRYLALTVLWSAFLLGLVAAIYGNLHVVYFNNVVVPSHIPVERRNLFFGSYQMYEYSADLLILLAGMGILRSLPSAGAARLQSQPRFILAFFAVALAMAPVSVRTYAVVGGDVNSFSHSVYFLLLGTILATANFLIAARPDGRMARACELWMIAGALLLLASGMPTRFTWQEIDVMRRPLPAVEAYRYDRRHPGEVYFPSNSVATYLAEGKFYETDWGVLNVSVAGIKLQSEDVFPYLPANAKYVAMPKGFLPLYFLTPLIAPHLIAANLPGLENFSVYLLER